MRDILYIYFFEGIAHDRSNYYRIIYLYYDRSLIIFLCMYDYRSSDIRDYSDSQDYSLRAVKNRRSSRSVTTSAPLIERTCK